MPYRLPKKVIAERFELEKIQKPECSSRQPALHSKSRQSPLLKTPCIPLGRPARSAALCA